MLKYSISSIKIFLCRIIVLYNVQNKFTELKNASGDIYIIRHGRWSRHTKIKPRLLEANFLAFCWSDIVTHFRGHASIQYELNYGNTRPFLNLPIDQSDRIAIQKDLLVNLYNANLISHSNDLTGAYGWLIENKPDKIKHLSTVYRSYLPLGLNIYFPTEVKSKKTNNSLSNIPISIVVNYRDKPELMKIFISSLVIQKTNRLIELILINNQSSAVAVEEISKYCNSKLDKRFSLIKLDYNLPYNHSAQTNLGVKVAKNEMIIIANNDVRLISLNAIDELVEAHNNYNFATIGTRIVGRNNRLVAAGMELYNWKLDKTKIGIRECEIPYFSLIKQSVVGNPFAFCAIKKSIWNYIGGLDENKYATQYNDADFCLRALSAGFKHFYLGNVKIYHEPGASDLRSTEQVVKLHENFCNEQVLNLNRPQFIKKFNKLKDNKLNIRQKIVNIIILKIYLLMLKFKNLGVD